MRTRLIIAATASVLAVGVAVAPAALAAENPELVSVTNSGNPFLVDVTYGEASDNGQRVAFTVAAHRPRLYLRDRTTGRTTYKYEASGSVVARNVDFSGNGRYVALLELFTSSRDTLRVHDLVDGSKELVHTSNLLARPSLSDSGRKIAYVRGYGSDNVPTAFVKNLDTGTSTRVSFGAPVGRVFLSGDGRKAVYGQYSRVYQRDLATGELTAVDVDPEGQWPNRLNAKPLAISDSGRYVLFTSSSIELVPDTEACFNDASGRCVFRRDVTAGTTAIASVRPDGQVITALNDEADLSGDGSTVAFRAAAEPASQVYVRALGTATTRVASVNAAGQPANLPTFGPALNQTGSLVTFIGRVTNFGRTNLSSDQLWLAAGI